MKKTLKILAIVAASFLLLGVLKNAFAGFLISASISKAAHVPAAIGSVDLRVIQARLSLKNVRLFNPRGYPEKLLLDMPEALIHFEPASVFRGYLHFKKIKLNLKELVVIKNKRGEVNVNALQPSHPAAKRSKKKAPPKDVRLHIDELNLSVGRVVYKDYSGGGDPDVQVFDINLRERTFKNVQSLSGVVNILMFETLTRTTLSRLANLDTSLFKSGADNALSTGLDLMSEGSDTAQSILDLFN